MLIKFGQIYIFSLFFSSLFTILEEGGIEVVDITDAEKGGGQMLTLADKGGREGQGNADIS